MDIISLLITSLFLFLVLMSSNNNLANGVLSAGGGCSTSKCGDSGRSPDIRFPFMVKDHDSSKQQASSCGYPGFYVWCDQQGSKETLIELPSSGNFSVKSIDYVAQEIWVNDVDNCLPKTLLSLNLTNSPFSMVYHQEFSFYNCSSSILVTNDNNATLDNNKGPKIVGPIPCLSGLDYFVYAIPLNNNTNNNNNISIANTTLQESNKCYTVEPMVKVPVQWPPSSENKTGLSSISKLNVDIRLSWFMPACQSCELHGQMCSMGTNSSAGLKNFVCSEITNQGRSRKLSLTTMIAVILILCFPSTICIVGSLFIWTRAYLRRISDSTSSELESEPEESVTTRPGRMIELGLEEVNVEFARQIVRLGLNNEPSPQFASTLVLSEIDEMGRSPSNEGDDNVCAICMVEYQAEDKLGTLPICGHYFHANCINEWLLSRGLIERSCPICRARVNH